MLHHLYLGYVKFHFHTKKNLQRGQGGLMKINHKLYAVYLDKQGIYHYFSPYCPHLKGLLSFDEKNQIWHCPCHQSVFDCADVFRSQRFVFWKWRMVFGR